MTEGMLLGFDYGTRRIGVAVGQTLTGSASPLQAVSVRENRPDWAAITRLVEQWRPTAFVVGLPLQRDGSEHAVSRAARRFGDRLRGRYNRPVYLVDERLSSAEAETRLPAAGRDRRASGALDCLAAQIILETWLQERARTQSS